MKYGTQRLSADYGPKRGPMGKRSDRREEKRAIERDRAHVIRRHLRLTLQAVRLGVTVADLDKKRRAELMNAPVLADKPRATESVAEEREVPPRSKPAVKKARKPKTGVQAPGKVREVKRAIDFSLAAEAKKPRRARKPKEIEQ